MASKIKSVTIVCQQGTHCYEIGKEYNGLLLDRIEDRSLEYPESFTAIYIGFTKKLKDNARIGQVYFGDRVFEAIGAPIDVEYMFIDDPDKGLKAEN